MYLVFGRILLLANIWFVRQVYETFFQPDIVIAPFEVVGEGSDTGTGKVLANLLQARLQQLVKELMEAQTSLDNPPTGQTQRGQPDVEQSDHPLPPRGCLSFGSPFA